MCGGCSGQFYGIADTRGVGGCRGIQRVVCIVYSYRSVIGTSVGILNGDGISSGIHGVECRSGLEVCSVDRVGESAGRVGDGDNAVGIFTAGVIRREKHRCSGFCQHVHQNRGGVLTVVAVGDSDDVFATLLNGKGLIC